ncbi:exopolyphosphatase/guanosine-5'-triphosphate,3'-diphosphate pyrophosphatase [Nocardioides massiliensis]|uniref:Exopolyphosphatase/guanosine-5'-triphosphate, 3'-diphosphate pyrophosphatase n=2 Tax=Nocardioides massiliensis TaxID=1325935 RepID=A0ABT9NIK3_9ACTN|nr:Ppx/GppA phosphatase family protein [Nocardioides massiliensis]MDP9820243.1 exopolyphosphatase/guanosine-5'-triphosphate,3'-diphosphate pyrophosphatase [Nocardioides massiliensis]
MTRVAAIDCGTNTVKLLVADLEPDGSSVEHLRTMRMVRLGQDVDRTGELHPDALARLFGALDEYAAIIADHDVTHLRFCATSAARDARNADEFTAGVQARLGVRPEVVSGDEEARLSFAGATRGLPPGLPGPFVVVDIGGGSTELVRGAAYAAFDPAAPGSQACSMDVGAVRLTERHLAGDPPTEAQVAAAISDIEAALDGAPVDLAEAGTVIGVAGTITTITADVLGLDSYDRAAIDGAVLAASDVARAGRRLLASTVAERRALPFLHPGRADVIGAGALILERVLARTGVESLRVSEADILDGIAWSLVDP